LNVQFGKSPLGRGGGNNFKKGDVKDEEEGRKLLSS